MKTKQIIARSILISVAFLLLVGYLALGIAGSIHDGSPLPFLLLVGIPGFVFLVIWAAENA